MDLMASIMQIGLASKAHLEPRTLARLLPQQTHDRCSLVSSCSIRNQENRKAGDYCRKMHSAMRCVSAVLVFLCGHQLYGVSQPSPSGMQSASPSSSQNYYFVSDVAYARTAKGTLFANIYLPKGQGPHPACLFIHGGAWRSGNRDQLTRVGAALAAQGYAGIEIDYDLTPGGARFPVALTEVKDAVRWMRAHAAQYDFDPNRIVAIGSSAGGELAAELGLTAGRREYETGDYLDQSSAVQAVVVFNGVLDLSDPDPGHEKMIQEYLGAPCTETLEACHEASPIFNVHAGAPPFFVGHGTADTVVPFRQAQRFVQLLRKSNVLVTPFIAQGAGHTYWARPNWFQPNLDALEQFLMESLKTERNESGERQLPSRSQGIGASELEVAPAQ
jgi:acetyl esterase/lipase